MDKEYKNLFSINETVRIEVDNEKIEIK